MLISGLIFVGDVLCFLVSVAPLWFLEGVVALSFLIGESFRVLLGVATGSSR